MSSEIIPPPWLSKNGGAPRSEPASVPPADEQDDRGASPIEGKTVVKDPLTGRFVKGSGGRPKGSRNKVSLAVDNLLDGEAEAVTRRCIELALKGDPVALKIVFDRICPVRKGRPLHGLTRKPGEGSIEALLRSVLDGEITPSEGAEVVGLIESAARVATAQALADMRRRQLEVLQRATENGTLRSGVMLVPVVEGDWELLAADAQQQLKAQARK